MSDETPETPPAAPAAPKSSKLVPILLVVNLLASGAGVALQQLRPAVAHAAPPAHDAAEEKKAAPVGPIVQIPSIIVNLNETGSGRYLKVSVELQLADKAAETLLEANKTIVRDALLRSLSNLTIAQTQGEESKDKIGAELVTRLEKELGADKVRRVFFTEFVVQ
jgi:flagellar protein FliL